MRTIKNFLINRKIQLGLGARLLIFMLLFSLFVGSQVYLTIWPVVSGLLSETTISFVKNRIYFRLLLFSFPILFVMLVLAVVFSHRIVGPIYRIERALDRLLQGEDVDFIKFRRGDELQELGVKINEFIRIVKEPPPSKQ